jgi:hypothetical protein
VRVAELLGRTLLSASLLERLLRLLLLLVLRLVGTVAHRRIVTHPLERPIADDAPRDPLKANTERRVPIYRLHDKPATTSASWNTLHRTSSLVMSWWSRMDARRS